MSQPITDEQVEGVTAYLMYIMGSAWCGQNPERCVTVLVEQLRKLPAIDSIDAVDTACLRACVALQEESGE